MTEMTNGWFLFLSAALKPQLVLTSAKSQISLSPKFLQPFFNPQINGFVIFLDPADVTQKLAPGTSYGVTIPNAGDQDFGWKIKSGTVLKVP
jgi:hypothetical protein